MKKFDRLLLLDCASELLSFLALQDPAYAERIQITRDEYKWDELQTALCYMARTLELGEHMWFMEREFLLPGYAGHLGPRPCVICGAEFSAGCASDTVCQKQACLDKHVEMLDAEFEKKAASNAK